MSHRALTQYWYSQFSALLVRLGCIFLAQAVAEIASSLPTTGSFRSMSSSRVDQIMLTLGSLSKSKVRESILGRASKAESHANVLSLTYLSLTYLSSLYLSRSEVKRITRWRMQEFFLLQSCQAFE